MQEKLTLFEKTIKKGDGNKWKTYFAMNDNGKSISVNLTDSAKTEILKSGAKFPLAITIDDDNYFITTDTFTNQDGVKLKYPRCVITSFITIEHAEIKKTTLADVFNADIEEFNN